MVAKYINTEEVVDLYEKEIKTIGEIAKIKGTYPERIAKILKEEGIGQRPKRSCQRLPYSLNHTYFKKIDSHEKAYLLGIMYSDGGIDVKSNGIQLVSNDEDLLDFFKKEISLSKEVYSNPSHPKAKTIYFSSEEMKRDLVSLGCSPQKSLTLEFPREDQVPKDFIWSFILGYFDGDGCISGKRHPQVKIISSWRFCEQLKQFLLDNNIKSAKVCKDDHHNIQTGYFRICSKKQIINFREKIYENVNFCLSRKKSKIFEV